MQDLIETYLFNSYNYFSKHRDRKDSYHSNLNFDSETSKWIIDKQNNIVEYLNNMIKEDIDSNKDNDTKIKN